VTDWRKDGDLAPSSAVLFWVGLQRLNAVARTSSINAELASAANALPFRFVTSLETRQQTDCRETGPELRCVFSPLHSCRVVQPEGPSQEGKHGLDASCGYRH